MGGGQRRREGEGAEIHLLIRVCSFGRSDQLSREFWNILEITGRIQVEIDGIGHDREESHACARSPDGQSVMIKSQNSVVVRNNMVMVATIVFATSLCKGIASSSASGSIAGVWELGGGERGKQVRGSKWR